MIDRDIALSVTAQAGLLAISRSSVYYQPSLPSADDLALIEEIDKIHLDLPFYGARRIKNKLQDRGISAGRERIATLMRKMGIRAISPQKKTSVPHPGHKVYPYLLKGLDIKRANQVWCADITYLPMKERILLSGSDYGLVKQAGTCLEAFKHPGYLLLY